MSFVHLLAGLDTVECSYYLDTSADACQLDFDQLGVEREALRNTKGREFAKLALGGLEFALLANGTQSGFPFVISNADFIIAFGEFNNPSFYVKFKSEALWREGARALHEKFLSWAGRLRLAAIKPEGLARVDFTFDYQIPAIDFDRDSLVSLSAKENNWRKDRKDQTLQFGVGDVVLRIYDKISEIETKGEKYWFEQLWGTFENVWRIEWQTRKGILKRFDIRTFQDLEDQQGDLLRYLVNEHDTMRIKGGDSNRSRWPLHPLWIDLQTRIAAFNHIGIHRSVDSGAELRERLTRMAISLYGYTKRIAAINAVLAEKEKMSIADALRETQAMIASVHDPLTWRQDVAKRIDAVRLGQW